MTKNIMLHLISVIIDLKNVMVPLMTPLASYDTDANTNGVNDQTSHIVPHFSFHNMVCNGAIDGVVHIT